jgi:membrane protease YdiL (CAAX protease family)
MSLVPSPNLEAAGTSADVCSQSFAVAEVRLRWFAFCVVLFVSFGQFIATSTYYAVHDLPEMNAELLRIRLLIALLSQLGALAVLWYVLSSQGRGWRDIGWKLKWTDAPVAVVLFLGTALASYLAYFAIQIPYHLTFGHYLKPKDLHSMMEAGLSAFSIAFVCVNPFFEELIVRGYLMSEILELKQSSFLAVIVSVAMQMSYHLYQGFAHCIGISAVFTIFSIYFVRTRRVAPLIFAHFLIDAYALLRMTL